MPTILDRRVHAEPAGDGVARDAESEGATPLAQVDLPSLLGHNLRESDVKRSRRIFVNRNLKSEDIAFIGFDMDYTLAIYNQPRIEALSVTCTLDKLVNKRSYPSEILDLDYDPTFGVRGIIVDRYHGNVFKMDRYGHVGRVYHGRRPVEREERRRLYSTQRIRLSSPRYAWIDTLFALPEAVMFARIVDWLDEHGDVGNPRYARLWRDIRECIDEAHRDESMKRVIKANLSDFIERDPDLPATLHKFRSAGKRLFLLTNSFWDYTDKVMSYLLDGQLPHYPSWRNYFDSIVVGAKKPEFFTERHPFIELDAAGHEKGPVDQHAGPLVRGRVYQGGNVVEFEQFLGAGGGDRVLYIGDHIYGDMLRAKKSSVWRTAMIVQELEREISLGEQMADKVRRVEAEERRRSRLEAELNYQVLVLRSLQRLEAGAVAANGAPVDERSVDAAMAESRARIETVRARLRLLDEDIAKVEDDIDRAFNPYWGALFKEGVENSRFGEQVEDYACLYTSRVSNFLAYSPLQYFRSPRDHMPHELQP